MGLLEGGWASEGRRDPVRHWWGGKQSSGKRTDGKQILLGETKEVEGPRPGRERLCPSWQPRLMLAFVFNPQSIRKAA